MDNTTSKTTIRGTVLRIIYASPNTDYKVCLFSVRETGEQLKVAGKGGMYTGGRYELTGKIDDNSKYGRQFNVYSSAEISEDSQHLSGEILESRINDTNRLRKTVTVRKIIYHSEENGFTVLLVEDVHRPEYFPFTAVGDALSVAEGCEYGITGQWRADEKRGMQFYFDSIAPEVPATRSGLIRYLSSGMFRGIGDVLAERIVDSFGEHTIETLDNNIEVLRKVHGLTLKAFENLRETWLKQRAGSNVLIFLQGLGISAAYAMKIYEKYGVDTVMKIRENPYRLINDINGIGFLKADAIAQSLGIRKESACRINAGIVYTLETAAQAGHCYLERKELLDECGNILEGVTEKNIARQIDTLSDQEGDAVYGDKKGNFIYLRRILKAENSTACSLRRILEGHPRKLHFGKSSGKAGNIEYSQQQIKSLEIAKDNNIMVLTGGPGTGKTTTLRLILGTFKDAGATVHLASPTGRAAKRMTESAGKYIGVEAKTIHRLLGFSPETGTFKFNSRRPLSGDLLVIDESSMLDIELASQLLSAVPDTMRIILVGDSDQLPSVGPGNVLKDIIDSGMFPVVKLSHIYRQEDTSDIILNAHRVNEGKMPVDTGNPHRDFCFLEYDDNSHVPELIVELVTKILPEHIPSEDIQVLSPMKKSPSGVNNLNMLLQTSLNSMGRSTRYGDTEYREGDKVMQLRNNYKKNVFNGDTGVVKNISKGTVEVDFGAGIVPYSHEELSELTLAYAITIHKSQGSEFPVVVIPMTTQFAIMLQRNLLYTAITRARRLCVLVGSKKAIAMAVHNNKVQKRNSKLKERLGTLMSKININGNIRRN